MIIIGQPPVLEEINIEIKVGLLQSYSEKLFCHENNVIERYQGI